MKKDGGTNTAIAVDTAIPSATNGAACTQIATKTVVHAWAVEGNIDSSKIKSNSFPLEWPPKSGKYIDVPEVDRGEWFSIEGAKQKILPVLTPLIDDLQENILGG